MHIFLYLSFFLCLSTFPPSLYLYPNRQPSPSIFLCLHHAPLSISQSLTPSIYPSHLFLSLSLSFYLYFSLCLSFLPLAHSLSSLYNLPLYVSSSLSSSSITRLFFPSDRPSVHTYILFYDR